MTIERVYAIWDYYDGIRTGIADFMGVPHYFEQEWSEQEQDYLPIFSLKPIAQSTLIQVLEQWQIFRAWELAFHRGELEQSTHPGLPGQNARYAELESVLKSTLADSSSARQCARGEFSLVPDQPSMPKGVMREVQVEWQPVV
jgi:hypothetical protein